jgi:hypothetical protein
MLPLKSLNKIRICSRIALVLLVAGFCMGFAGCDNPSATLRSPAHNSLPDALPPLPSSTYPARPATVTTSINPIQDFTIRDADGNAVKINVQTPPADEEVDQIRQENIFRQIVTFVRKLFPDRDLTDDQIAGVANIYIRFVQKESLYNDAVIFQVLLGVTREEFGALSMSSEISLDSPDIVVERERVLQSIRQAYRTKEN